MLDHIEAAQTASQKAEGIAALAGELARELRAQVDREGNIRALVNTASLVASLFGTDHPVGRTQLKEEVATLRRALQPFHGECGHKAGKKRRTAPMGGFLHLSTAHLTPEAAAWLYLKLNDGIGYLGHHGFFVHCQEDPDSPGKICPAARPATLTRLFQHALDNGCSHILFDQDAETDPAFPTFECEKETALQAVARNPAGMRKQP